jgi:hypothetical protein
MLSIWYARRWKRLKGGSPLADPITNRTPCPRLCPKLGTVRTYSNSRRTHEIYIHAPSLSPGLPEIRDAKRPTGQASASFHFEGDPSGTRPVMGFHGYRPPATFAPHFAFPIA